MSQNKNLAGRILVSQPKSDDPYFSKSVILVAKHGSRGSWGLMINKATPNLTLGTIMQAVGIDSNKSDRVYVGGPVDTHRVCVVHSMDWQSYNTIQIAPDLGITNELQVLAAISQNEGPALFRTCIGSCGWGPGQLDGELQGKFPWKSHNAWLDAPADIESVFSLSEDDQWQKGIELVAKTAVDKWF
jgi:putative transcriptional regulator